MSPLVEFDPFEPVVLLCALLFMLLFMLPVVMMPVPVTLIFASSKRPLERQADERCQMRPNHSVHIGDEPSAATIELRVRR